MKLQELFLIETADEDRAIVSLATAIHSYVSQYAVSKEDEVDDYSEYDDDYDDEYGTDSATEDTVSLGTVGQLFNTPLSALNTVHLYVQPDYSIRKRAADTNVSNLMTRPEDGTILGLWYPGSKSIIFNEDYLRSNALRKAIAHELRHALDDAKSDSKAGTSQYYARPKSKEHQRNPGQAYLAGPDEINARYAEVLSNMVGHIKRSFVLPAEEIKPKIMQHLKQELEKNSIAQLFPEKHRSPQYKRLINRALEFIQKEVAYIESEKARAGTPKQATGSYSD